MRAKKSGPNARVGDGIYLIVSFRFDKRFLGGTAGWCLPDKSGKVLRPKTFTVKGG